jgi:hypothetical protein
MQSKSVHLAILVPLNCHRVAGGDPLPGVAEELIAGVRPWMKIGRLEKVLAVDLRSGIAAISHSNSVGGVRRAVSNPMPALPPIATTIWPSNSGSRCRKEALMVPPSRLQWISRT